MLDEDLAGVLRSERAVLVNEANRQGAVVGATPFATHWGYLWRLVQDITAVPSG
ncbi:MAG: hypothetical protein LBL72_11905 [Candidatus Accumulibacter sp.]|nr:hypothetical protein [Accumulibacter sp.]